MSGEGRVYARIANPRTTRSAALARVQTSRYFAAPRLAPNSSDAVVSLPLDACIRRTAIAPATAAARVNATDKLHLDNKNKNKNNNTTTADQRCSNRRFQAETFQPYKIT